MTHDFIDSPHAPRRATGRRQADHRVLASPACPNQHRKPEDSEGSRGARDLCPTHTRGSSWGAPASRPPAHRWRLPARLRRCTSPGCLYFSYSWMGQLGKSGWNAKWISWIEPRANHFRREGKFDKHSGGEEGEGKNKEKPIKESRLNWFWSMRWAIC